MPCYITGSREGDRELTRSANEKVHRQTVKDLQKVTRFLCEACHILDVMGVTDENLSGGLAAWREEHAKIDRKRRRRKRT